MRKIVGALFLSLDGVAEKPDRWVFPYFIDDVGKVVDSNIASTDAMLLGRRTYEEWAAYWPNKSGAEDDFADFINPVRKYVVTRTLDSVEWQNSTLIKGDLRDEVTKLKDQPGKDIGVNGSITLIGSLMREGLLDELSLLIFPVVVGNGKRLFEASNGQIPLELIDSQAFDNGVLSLRYRAIPSAK